MKTKANKCRTRLLMLLSTECNTLIKNSSTKINSVSFAEAEKEYSKNFHMFHLQPEIYSPSSTEIGEGGVVHTQQSIEKSYVLTQESDYSFSNNICTSRIAQRKLSIAQKKIDYFKQNVIVDNANKRLISSSSLSFTPHMKRKDSICVLDNLQYINVDSGVMLCEKTKKRAEHGFSYLQSLMDKLKLRTKRKKSKKKNPNFAEVKRMLCLKENIVSDTKVDQGNNQSNKSNKLNQDRRISVPRLNNVKDSSLQELRNSVHRSYSVVSTIHEKLYSKGLISLQNCVEEDEDN